MATSSVPAGHVTTGTVVCHHERRVKVQVNFLTTEKTRDTNRRYFSAFYLNSG